MKTADDFQAGFLLGAIRDLYGTLCAMTRRFLDEFSFPALQDLLKERSLVLQKIYSEKERLMDVADPGHWHHFDEYGEIMGHIATITACDREISARITNDMHDITRRLSSLSETSNAVKMYIRHYRRGKTVTL